MKIHLFGVILKLCTIIFGNSASKQKHARIGKKYKGMTFNIVFETTMLSNFRTRFQVSSKFL